MVELELILIPLPGEMVLAVTPEAGVLLEEIGALLVVDVGISQETMDAEKENWVASKRATTKVRPTLGRLATNQSPFFKKRLRSGIKKL
jgi:hypothetical protein